VKYSDNLQSTRFIYSLFLLAKSVVVNRYFI